VDATVSLEREVKLSIPQDVDLPDLNGAIVGLRVSDHLHRELDATYYDTSDFRLTRAGLSLRRRSGESAGPATWTLKIAAPGDGSAIRRRYEIKVDNASDAVPDTLERMILTVTRGAPTVPVARVTTSRDVITLKVGDQSVAELSDDTVDIIEDGREAGRYREIEVELSPETGDDAVHALVATLRQVGAGDPVADSKLARAAGSVAALPPDPAVPAVDRHSDVGPVLQAILGAEVRTLQRLLPLVHVEASVEVIHDARVATRRLRSHLRTFGDLFEPARREDLRVDLKWLGTQLGAVRDLDVFMASLESNRGALEETDRSPMDRLVRQYQIERDTRVGELRAALGSRRATALAESSVAFVSELPLVCDPAGHAKPPIVAATRRVLRKLSRLARHLDDDSPMGDLHRLRIRAKRARYATEAAGHVAKTGELARRIGELQDVLGDLHDTATVEARLRETAQQNAPAEAFVAGFIVSCTREHADRLRSRWQRQWRQVQRELRRQDAFSH
jgi:CHAD domain-containing protein